jgi:hypothetical protein
MPDDRFFELFEAVEFYSLKTGCNFPKHMASLRFSSGVDRTVGPGRHSGDEPGLSPVLQNHPGGIITAGHREIPSAPRQRETSEALTMGLQRASVGGDDVTLERQLELLAIL